MESLRVLMIHLLLLELGVADVARGDGLLGWLWWRKPLCSNNVRMRYVLSHGRRFKVPNWSEAILLLDLSHEMVLGYFYALPYPIRGPRCGAKPLVIDLLFN